MNSLVQEATDREINRAIVADEQANAHFYQIIRQFLSSKSVIADEILQPDARLDAGGLKEIDTAWLLVQATANNLRRSYMKLYKASL